MNSPGPDPNNPHPTPDNPNPEPVRPPIPPETPSPKEPPGVPPPSPDPIPAPDEEPVQIPPGSPPEVPSEPSFPAPTASRMLALAAATLLCWTGATGSAAGQTSDGNDGVELTNPCRVEPEDRNEGTERNGEEGGNDEADNGSRPSLEDCNGVLIPPRTGDEEIEKPAPTREPRRDSARHRARTAAALAFPMVSVAQLERVHGQERKMVCRSDRA